MASAALIEREVKPAVPAEFETRVVLDLSVREAALVALILGPIPCGNALTDPYPIYRALRQHNEVLDLVSTHTLVNSCYTEGRAPDLTIRRI